MIDISILILLFFWFVFWTLIIVQNIEKKKLFWVHVAIFLTGILWGMIWVIIINFIIKKNGNKQKNKNINKE